MEWFSKDYAEKNNGDKAQKQIYPCIDLYITLLLLHSAQLLTLL